MSDISLLSRATPSSTESTSQAYRKYSDLEMFLHGLEMPHLVPIFHKQAIDFACLQSMTEADLEKVNL